MATWIEDDNGNKCSVAYFGSKEAAQKALDSLIDCKNCINCTDCSDCSRCTDCTKCSDCSRCTGCSYCSYCTDCIDCTDCSHCLRCTKCSYCTKCSHCSYCLRCSRCSRCSGEKDKKGDFVPPAIPKIEDIHSAVYAAATAKDGAFDMSRRHTCGTTHCRAGWVVHLAGEAGYALEEFHDTALAAQLIYRESGYRINPCRFYDDNDDALADMKRLAEQEQAA